MSWRAVDAGGVVLGPERASPAAALAAAPVVTWPLAVEDGGGRRRWFADVLGARVAELADAGDVDVERLAPQTPAGRVDLPLDCVDATAGAGTVADPLWLAEVDRRRTAAREAAVAAGRGEELEAALHVVLLLALGSGDRVASGARLWLLGGAVASALSGEPDAFHPWGRLAAAGWWPIGPCGGRLVVSPPA